jgi:hypothetical protein
MGEWIVVRGVERVWVCVFADWNRMYLSGTATQGTYWKEDGYGSNVTAKANGKHYERVEPWDFYITEMVG